MGYNHGPEIPVLFVFGIRLLLVEVVKRYRRFGVALSTWREVFPPSCTELSQEVLRLAGILMAEARIQCK